jgi:hypothetical protein
MSHWEERASRNEALFREVNERVEELHGRLESDEWGGFVCECADDGCTRRIHLPLATYERVRSDPRRFLVLPGHERLELERVVEERDRFLVVEKNTPVALEVVESTNPRD